MNIVRTINYCLACLVILNATSCVVIMPHENFKNDLRLWVGANIDSPHYNIKPELLLSTRILDNGNIEYRYRYLGDCVRLFEVDPKSRIILRVGFEGSEKFCILPP